MQDEIQKIRELIAGNRIDAALKAAALLMQNDTSLKNQVATLAATFRNVRSKENLGLIGSSEAFTIYAQVNYGLLNLLGEAESKESSTFVADNSSEKNTVFISYSHADSLVAGKIKESLKPHNIDTIIDTENMHAGQDIQEFIKTSIRDTKATVSIVSKKSLLSSWVAMETIHSYHHLEFNTKKCFIPCYIEDDFFDRRFTDGVLAILDKELNEIENIRIERMRAGRDTRDLNNEYSRTKELSNNLDEIVRRLRESKCIDLRNKNFHKNIKDVIRRVVGNESSAM